ncbi:sensor histidine kinase [Sphingomonas sp.]|uniref:sensor histidine kinase n=1 Tax=Sphingomonas sp. TaxID=28214 RepID=UPI0035BC8C79
MATLSPSTPPDHASSDRSYAPTVVRGSDARLTTGAKLFLILSAALLPLALIAMVATLKTTRVADAETRARLRLSANESARAIGIELVGDMTALRVAVNALRADPADAPSCARAQGVFAQQSANGTSGGNTRFVIADRSGRVVCGEPLPIDAAIPHADMPIAAAIVAGKGLVLAVAGPDDRVTARAYFPQSFLARIGAPSARGTTTSSVLIHDDEALPLETMAEQQGIDRVETMRTDLGIAGLQLATSVPSAPITSSLIIALLLPLLMWAAAASIGWFVVDRLLIRPLRRLRSSVASFMPGDLIDPRALGTLPAQEIRELGETFRAISRTVALHEAGLAEGLVRQTKLTREVHHRVKNNLQVISSLINFHARGAPSPDATAAYAAIQRRVDALAVVHRNHFAEMEENRGLNLKPVLGELAANIRATASPESHAMGIVLDVDPFLVTQDVAVAVAFLITEMIELATGCDPVAQVRIALKPAEQAGRAVLRVVSRALIDSEELRDLSSARYGRVMEGLSRQLRAPLFHDPLTGAYEIAVAIVGRD